MASTATGIIMFNYPAAAIGIASTVISTAIRVGIYMV
jgi:hypothetical protein